MSSERRRTALLLPIVSAVVGMIAVLIAFVPAEAVSSDPSYCAIRSTSNLARRAACHWKDARKDAPARADLLHAKVRAGKKAFRVSFRVRDLKRTGSFVLGAGVGGWGANYFVKKRAHTIVIREQTVSEVHVYDKVACPGSRVTWNARTNVVRARFAYRCAGRFDYVINGIDFHSRGATDHLGKVYYRP